MKFQHTLSYQTLNSQGDQSLNPEHTVRRGKDEGLMHHFTAFFLSDLGGICRHTTVKSSKYNINHGRTVKKDSIFAAQTSAKT